MSEIPHNDNDNTVPLTDEMKAEMLRHSLSRVVSLVKDLEPANPFAGISGPESTGDMQSATDTAEVKQALHSLKAATAELNTVETVVGLVEFIASRLGYTLI